MEGLKAVMIVDQDLLLVWDEMPLVGTCMIFERTH